MLRNLLTRRGPRYGGFVCTVMSALLIILSISLLRSHFAHCFPSHEVNYDTLLSDSTNDDASGGEDTINALDIVDEQTSQESATDAEEEDENTRASGYFFHRVEGVIRRSFSKRPTVENWDGLIGIFDSTDDDSGETAFVSDDVAVDERVKLMAMKTKGIEDVLLLKDGKGVSALREGWGEWFDKKSDYLRRDKMLRSNLNPLHNPMLQDPDSVGLTGLTKGDKLVHKALMHDLNTIPFPSSRKMMS